MSSPAVPEGDFPVRPSRPEPSVRYFSISRRSEKSRVSISNEFGLCPQCLVRSERSGVLVVEEVAVKPLSLFSSHLPFSPFPFLRAPTSVGTRQLPLLPLPPLMGGGLSLLRWRVRWSEDGAEGGRCCHCSFGGGCVCFCSLLECVWMSLPSFWWWVTHVPLVVVGVRTAFLTSGKRRARHMGARTGANERLVNDKRAQAGKSAPELTQTDADTVGLVPLFWDCQIMDNTKSSPIPWHHRTDEVWTRREFS